jgi:hypothetical protein
VLIFLSTGIWEILLPGRRGQHGEDDFDYNEYQVQYD